MTDSRVAWRVNRDAHPWPSSSSSSPPTPARACTGVAGVGRAMARTRHVRDGSVRLLERLNASKLSLCVIRHVRRTGGRVLRWLAAISHTALIVFILVVVPVLPPELRSLHFTPSNSRRLARSRQMYLIPSLVALAFLSRSCSIFMRCGVHFTWHSAGFCPSPGFSPSLLLSFSLYLSIVHNYTIRLLNRLMRPPLPVVAAPFTETTGRARASLSLPPSLRLARVLEILKLSPTHPLAYFFPARVCPLACPDFFDTSASRLPFMHYSPLFCF